MSQDNTNITLLSSPSCHSSSSIRSSSQTIISNISSLTSDSSLSNNNQNNISIDDNNTERILIIRNYEKESENWSKKQKLIIIDEINEYYLTNTFPPPCCLNNCIRKFSLLDIQYFRYLFNKENNERKRILLNQYKEEKQILNKDKFILGENEVCIKGFSFIIRISLHSIYNSQYKNYKYKNKYTNNILILNENENENEMKKTYIMMYFSKLIEFNDIMPNTGETHLPHPSKYDLYINYIYELEIKNLNEYKCSWSYFYTIWKDKYNNVKIKRCTTFTKCDFCEERKELIATTLNSIIRNKAKKELKEHYKFVEKERDIYYEKRLKGRIGSNIFNSNELISEKYISIIIDGSDMASYGLPYFSRPSKETVVGYKMLMKLIGVIVHGRGAWIFVVHKNWPADPNLIIEVLHRVFCFIQPTRGYKLFLQVI